MIKNIGNILLEKEILLESGTNEVEILVFHVGIYRLGINVAKVREILPSQDITHLPKAHPSVIGCFRLRDIVVPCVSLHRHLGQEPEKTGQRNLILAEFNRSQTAFVVDEVERIHRISWEHILPMPAIVTEVASPVTAVTNLDGSLVSMLDFETIAADISQEDPHAAVVSNQHGIPRNSFRIVVADDSATVRKAVEGTLHENGYTQVFAFEHGRQAWNWIEQRLSETGDASKVCDLLVSDVEMPSMDGLHLTQNVKQHAALRNLPVILYSSILTPDNIKKGTAVGADAQITKPELNKVVELADELIMKRQAKSSSDAESEVGLSPPGSVASQSTSARSSEPAPA